MINTLVSSETFLTKNISQFAEGGGRKLHKNERMRVTHRGRSPTEHVNKRILGDVGVVYGRGNGGYGIRYVVVVGMVVVGMVVVGTAVAEAVLEKHSLKKELFESPLSKCYVTCTLKTI